MQTIRYSKKGEETRRQIVEAAKQLFYAHGYAKTSIKDICALAGAKIGTFTYYFKTKDDLVNELYANVFAACYEFVEQHLNRRPNSLEKNTIVGFIYFHAILADEKTRAFHHEILLRGSVGDYITTSAYPISEQFIQDLELGLTARDLKDIDLAENGLSREIVTHFLENPGYKSIAELTCTVYTFRARLFTVNEAVMQEYLKNGMDFESQHAHGHITLLGKR